jgi:hypothetical protein
VTGRTNNLRHDATSEGRTLLGTEPSKRWLGGSPAYHDGNRPTTLWPGLLGCDEPVSRSDGRAHRQETADACLLILRGDGDLSIAPRTFHPAIDTLVRLDQGGRQERHARADARRFHERQENTVGVRHTQGPAGVSLAHLSQRGDTRRRLMMSVTEGAVKARRFRAESRTSVVRNYSHLTPV